MTRWYRRRYPDRDRGASLVLVLILVTVVAMGLSVLLSFVDSSLRVTVQLRGQAADTYRADGAMQAAVNTLRTGDYTGATGQHCFGGTDTLQLTRFYGDDSAAVTCAADPQKVRIQCPSASQCNRPGAAILTLGRVAGEDGVNVKQPATSTFNVHGTVFSNSTIDVVTGTLKTNAAVYARGACTGTIQSTPNAACNYGTTANTLGNDPGYLPQTSTVPAYRALPACTRANSVVTFQPGYYDDAAGLSAMMAGNSGCRHSTWWFTPGVYYFDFHNAGTGRNALLPAAGDTWTVNDGYLVAGTPVDATGKVVSAPANPAVLPGACDNPIDDPAASGVQFIFGGDSQFAVKAGQVEICGSYSATRPPVAVYGLTSGTGSTTALTGTAALALSAVPAPGGFGASATVANLATVDATRFASWRTTKKNDSTTLTVSGFGVPAAIPAGSVLRSAAVRVVHRHSDTGSTDPLTVSVTPTGGTAVTGTAAGGAGGTAMRTDLVAADTALTGSLAQAVYAGTYSGAQIAVTVRPSANNDTEDVDAVALELTYTPPALRAGSGCVTATPYGSGTACALVSTVNNAGNQFYVQGTTYAPAAVVDLILNNAAEQVFRFGVVVRSLWLTETGSFSYTGPVIEVPDDSPGFLISVYLEVYLCPGAASCATTGTPVLRARVAMRDESEVDSGGTGEPEGAGHRQVAVLSWTRPG